MGRARTCSNCYEEIFNPVEHEFCRKVILPEKPELLTAHFIAAIYHIIRLANFINNLPQRIPEIRRAPEVQGKITHQFAASNARPSRYAHPFPIIDDDNTLETAINILEDHDGTV